MRWVDEDETRHPDDELWTRHPWLFVGVLVLLIVLVLL